MSPIVRYARRVNEQLGRRARKKAETRQTIADVALRLFLERGFDAVGIREIAREADVALTTLFLHFPSKESLVFDEDSSRRERLVAAVTDRGEHESVPESLHRVVYAIMCDERDPSTAAYWAMVDDTPALRAYANTMWMRHEEALARALADELGLPGLPVGCRAVARYVLDAYVLVVGEADQRRATAEIFALIDAAWSQLLTRVAAEPTRDR